MNNSKKEPPGKQELLIGIVGPCAAGKSTLIEGLNQAGYTTRHIAQEHSYVKDMWKRLTNPDILVFLDAAYPTTISRRNLDWSEADWQEQQRRLAHAREHADIYIQTDSLTREEVLQKAINFIENWQKGLQ